MIRQGGLIDFLQHPISGQGSARPKPFNYGEALARRACASLSLLTFSTSARVCAVFILIKNRSLFACFFLDRFKQILLPKNINNKQGL
jgi:hypothetical protein